MIKNKKIILQDENGMKIIAEILTMLEIDNVSYVVYTIDNSLENNDVYTARIVKDDDENQRIVSIKDFDEKQKVFDIVRKMIDEC